MLFNTHDFCGTGNHFSMLGLGKSGKIMEKVWTTFLVDLSEGRKN